ncbi:hypothetical protein KP509_28G068500 [Ceratopteris richardii]|uniref:Cyclin delta-3 n=1 Tax=Ceratopteris richardii TaxID=49495 RepID=A0A8T2RFJ6_CERRI|nr:hypothetical protein KP509_28G068500 [Ceratopteris richardii]
MLRCVYPCVPQVPPHQVGATCFRSRPKTSPLIRCLISAPDHITYVKEVASVEPPPKLGLMLDLLQIRGAKLVSPLNKKGILPLVIPLAEDTKTGTFTALLRWPTPPEGMEMPVVEVQKHGVFLLAKTIDQYIHRLLVEEDTSRDNSQMLHKRCEYAGVSLYKPGDFDDANMPNVQVYLMKKVGLFPDVFEYLSKQHLERGDQVSALITAEFYANKKHFPGFARPFVFNAELMCKIGRDLEAKDAAKVALKSPWWTLGCKYEDVAKIAGWGDEQIEYMKEKVTEEGKKEELHKGKAPAQIALDQAAFLLDLASIDGSWDDIRSQLAECYREAGLAQISDFVLLTN